MRLPIVTCLPLQLLARDPREFPSASEDVKVALTALGITELWRLLTYTRPEFISALAAAKRAGATNIATMRTLYALDALFVKEVPHIGFGTLPAELRDVPAGTPIDMVFVSPVHPPLTLEQLAILRCQPVALGLAPEVLAWARRMTGHSTTFTLIGLVNMMADCPHRQAIEAALQRCGMSLSMRIDAETAARIFAPIS